MSEPDDRHVSPPKSSVCSSWAQPDDVRRDDADQIEEQLLDDSLLMASDILFDLSGRRWAGACQDTVRPVLRGLSQDYGRPVRPPYPFGGPYGYWPSAGINDFGPTWGFWLMNRTDRAGGQIVPEITLGAYPLISIVEILIDGQVLPAVDPVSGTANYRIDDDRWLVRLADPATHNNPGWPTFNDMDLNADQPNTWQVTFTYGQMPPIGGVRAAAAFGYQLALAANPKTRPKAQLPQRLTNINRQGMTAVVIDPMAFIKEGRTGLYEVDMWLGAVNRGVAFPEQAAVISPDIGRRVRRAGV